jgi:phage-related protein
MAATWGEAEVQIHIDGDSLPREVKETSIVAGEQGGKDLSKAFNKSLKKNFAPNTSRLLGPLFKKMFAGISTGANKAMSAIGPRFNGALNKLRGNLQKTTDSIKNGFNKARTSATNLFKTITKGTKTVNRHSSSWKNLSHNMRQWTLIIGSIAILLPELGGLTSAAGVGILTLASAITSLGIGLGVTVAAFKRFTGDIEDLPDDVKGARKAFDGLKDTLHDLNSELTSAVFKDSAKTWDRLSDTIKQLEGPLTKVAEKVAGIIESFGEWASTPAIVEKLKRIIEQSAVVFDSLVRSVGIFGDALLTAFDNPAMVSAVAGLTGWIRDLAEGFAAFVESPAYSEWVTNGASVFEHLGGLLTSLGDALSGLFDKQTTDNLNDFIDGVAKFVDGPLKSLVDLLDALDIPNIFIDLLNDLGTALQPVVEGITAFVKANPGAVESGLKAIAAGFIAIKAVKIGTTVVSGLAAFTGITSRKNISNAQKFAGAVAGIAVAFDGLKGSMDKAGGGLEGGGGSVLESIAGGALAGGSIAGLPGLLIGALTGAIASMITDMFLSPEVEGAWKTGWDQLFDPTDTTGAVIGPIKEWWTGTLEPFISDLGSNLATYLWDPIANVFLIITDGITAFIDGFLALWNGFWGGLPAAITTWYEDTLATITTWFEGVSAEFQRWWGDITTGWTTFWTGLPEAIATWYEDTLASITRWWEQVSGEFERWVGDITSGWQNFWKGLPGVVKSTISDILSTITRWWEDISGKFTQWIEPLTSRWDSFWEGFPDAVNTAVQEVINFIDDLFAPIQSAIGWFNGLFGAASSAKSATAGAGTWGNSNSFPHAASGMLLNGPRRLLAGEAGPEAVVPLRRSLSRVDPSVRALSAIAQGLPIPAGSGGGAMAGRSLNIEPGAIVIQGVRDPNAAALGVVSRIAERLAG